MTRAALATMLIVMCSMGTPASLAQAEPLEPFIDAALAAHGGAQALAGDATVVITGKATMQFGPASVEGDLIRTRAGSDRVRTVVRASFRGSLTESISALDGTRAWSSRMGRTVDLPPTNMKIDLAHDLDIIARAAAPGAKVSDLGETISGERTLRRIELDEAGQTTRLLFDPGTHLLAEMEYRAVQNEGMGESKEVATRKVYGDYRTVSGAPYPHTLTQFRDGVQSLHLVVTSVERGAKVDGALFQKPEEEDERMFREEFAN